MNTIGSSSSEILSYMFGSIVFTYFGLKKSFSAFFMLAAIGSMALLFVDPETTN